MSSKPVEQLINIIFTDIDVEDIAEEKDISIELAMERATEWAKHIEATAIDLINEQLASVIATGHP